MRPTIVRAVSCAALVLVAAGNVAAQVEQGRAFEVASVRLADRPGLQARPSSRVTDTRLDASHASLRNLLLRAFRLDLPWQLSFLSAPDWVKDVYVEIHATFPDGSTREHVPEMLKTLLATRFGLRTHTEARPTDVYELVVSDGGVRMEEVPAVDEVDKEFPVDPSRPPLMDQTREGLEGRTRTIFTGRGLIYISDRTMYERIATDRGTYILDATRITMWQLAGYLSATVDRPVVDGTNLSGVYTFRVELPPENWGFALPPTLGVSRTPEGTPRIDPSGVSAFTVAEDLGLRLEPRRIPLDTIVIDQIDRAPTEN